MTEDVTFALLGPVRMWRSETEVPAGSPQQRALVAMLLIQDGRVASFDEIYAVGSLNLPPTGSGTNRGGRLKSHVSSSGARVSGAVPGTVAATSSRYEPTAR